MTASTEELTGINDIGSIIATSIKEYFNDINKQAIETVKRNALKLKVLEQCDLKNMDFKDYLTSINRLFDIIFLDPPYKMNNVDEILSLIYQYKLLKSKGIIAFEMESQTNPDSKYYKIIKDRSYGIKRVVIYKEEI